MKQCLNCISKGNIHSYHIIWFKAYIKEGKPVNLYQCSECMKTIMAIEQNIEAEEYKL